MTRQPLKTSGVRTIAAALLVVAVVLPFACQTTGKPRKKRYGKAVIAVASKANKTCFECHMDFKDEGMTVEHQAAGVSCVRCHGKSMPHMEDEARMTPPEVIFKGQAMRTFCLTCHDRAAHAKATPLHAAEMAKNDKRKTCTACHFDHKLVSMPEPKKTGQ